MDLSVLEKNIGYKFRNINLLKKALTHTSYANENHIESNEKLKEMTFTYNLTDGNGKIYEIDGFKIKIVGLII